MGTILHSLPRRLLPLMLLALSAAAAATPVYRAHVIAPPYRLGDVEMFWYVAMDVNNQGTSLLSSYQYALPGVGFVVYDRRGQLLRQVGSFSRYGGSLIQAIDNHGDVAGHEWAGYYWIGRVQKDQGFGATIHGFPEG